MLYGLKPDKAKIPKILKLGGRVYHGGRNQKKIMTGTQKILGSPGDAENREIIEKTSLKIGKKS